MMEKGGDSMKVIKKAKVQAIQYVTEEVKAGKCKHCILAPGPDGCHCN